MPHVSTKPMSKETSVQIHKLLLECFSQNDVSLKSHKAFINEILTKTEKEMLGKRLAAISLMSQGLSVYKTSKKIKLGQPTVNKIKIRLEKNYYKNTLNVCRTARKDALGKYFENLFKPLPRYGTSPSSLVRKH